MGIVRGRMDYCDTNILTAFVNRNNLKRELGGYAYNKFKDRIKGMRSESAERKSKSTTKCTIAREPLINDLGDNPAVVGAVLTSSGLKNIEIRSVKNGYKTGKKFYNIACGKSNPKSSFYNKFCENKRLKKTLNYSDRNDIMHFGSAVKLNSKRFITDNLKDFEELKKHSNIDII